MYHYQTAGPSHLPASGFASPAGHIAGDALPTNASSESWAGMPGVGAPYGQTAWQATPQSTLAYPTPGYVNPDGYAVGEDNEDLSELEHEIFDFAQYDDENGAPAPNLRDSCEHDSSEPEEPARPLEYFESPTCLAATQTTAPPYSYHSAQFPSFALPPAYHPYNQAAEPHTIPMSASAQPMAGPSTTSSSMPSHSAKKLGKKRARSADAEDAPEAPPPVKKPRGEQRAVPEPESAAADSLEPPQPGPSEDVEPDIVDQAEDAPTENLEEGLADAGEDTEEAEQTEDENENAQPHVPRPRRGNAQLAATTLPLPPCQCGAPGCQFWLRANKGDKTRGHVKSHYHPDDTKSTSTVQLACVWAGCHVVVSGHQMVRHVEEAHVGFAMICPACDWKGSRSKDQSQHWDRKHPGWRQLWG